MKLAKVFLKQIDFDCRRRCSRWCKFYILQQLIENQKIFNLLDSSPKLLSAKSHRPAYGGDGDYFSKPSEDDIFEAVYEIMNESNPNDFPI